MAFLSNVVLILIIYIAVRAAKRVKGLKIVSSDWLEDSLLSKSRRPKREGPYLWSQLTKKARKASSGRKEADKDANTKQINGLYKTLFRGLQAV